MPRKTLKQKEKRNPTENQVNRLRSVMDNLVGIEDPDDLMLEVLNVLSESGRIPSAGKYYTFVYQPKTLNVSYDQNPLVAVTDVFPWGFRGINFHWGEVRQYTWSEVAGSLYEIYQEEIADAREIPFQNIRLNS